jgi:hypothetical protein
MSAHDEGNTRNCGVVVVLMSVLHTYVPLTG